MFPPWREACAMRIGGTRWPAASILRADRAAQRGQARPVCKGKHRYVQDGFLAGPSRHADLDVGLRSRGDGLDLVRTLYAAAFGWWLAVAVAAGQRQNCPHALLVANLEGAASSALHSVAPTRSASKEIIDGPAASEYAAEEISARAEAAIGRRCMEGGMTDSNDPVAAAESCVAGSRHA